MPTTSINLSGELWCRRETDHLNALESSAGGCHLDARNAAGRPEADAMRIPSDPRVDLRYGTANPRMLFQAPVNVVYEPTSLTIVCRVWNSRD